jgi:hypothetical protein
LRIVLDTNVVTRRWKQMITFMKRLGGRAKVASLAELEAELADGEDEVEAKQRVKTFKDFLKFVPHGKYATRIRQVVMLDVDSDPTEIELKKDRRIRAEIGELVDRLSRENPGKKVVVLFLTFDAGCRRLMTAVRSPEGVEFIVPRLENDITGPGIIDVVHGVVLPYLESKWGIVQ